MKPINSPAREQAKFSERLAIALSAAGVSASPTHFSREFNLRSSETITVHGARKWLCGESIPTHGRLQSIADWLDVSAAWLRFGDAGDAGTSPNKYLHALECDQDGVVSDYLRLTPEGQFLMRELVVTLLKAQGEKS